MLVNPLGKDVKARFAHPQNALLPMLVTPLGKDVKARLVQEWNA